MSEPLPPELRLRFTARVREDIDHITILINSSVPHTDLMENCEQVFDEPLFRRHCARQNRRVTVRSDNSLRNVVCDPKP